MKLPCPLSCTGYGVGLCIHVHVADTVHAICTSCILKSFCFNHTCITTVAGVFSILWRLKITFLIFTIQQIVQSLVNQLGVDSAQANISTTSSVSVSITMNEIINSSLLTLMYNYSRYIAYDFSLQLLAWLCLGGHL